MPPKTPSAVPTSPASLSANARIVLEKRYLVTFMPNAANSANFGPQKPLLCASGYSCAHSGCAPMVSMPFLYRYAATDATTVGMAFGAAAGSGAGASGRAQSSRLSTARYGASTGAARRIVAFERGADGKCGADK